MTTQPLPLAQSTVVRGTPQFPVDPTTGLPLGQRTTNTRTYDYTGGQRITIVAAQTRSTAVSASEVMLHASARCFVTVGNSSVAATIGSNSFPLEAGEKFHLRIAAGQYISVIRESADGYLTIMPVIN